MSCENKCNYSFFDWLMLTGLFWMVFFGGCDAKTKKNADEANTKAGQALGEIRSFRSDFSKDMEQIRTNQKMMYDILAIINGNTNRMPLTNIYLENR